jgi:hypothetical protein
MYNYPQKKIFPKSLLLLSISGNPNHLVHDCARVYKSLQEIPLTMKGKKFSSVFYANNRIVKIKVPETNLRL